MIKRLSPQVSNKIAAGEVVERPSAVVKELVENSIDAGSTEILIEIKDAGKALIRVSDNGCGILPSDLALLFERHATSKIEKLEDIYAINSLGFRGEALASIASVSRVEMITKTQNMNTGYRVFVNMGLISEPEPIGATNGTTFVVRDLFFNTPVRYKFLKSNQAEQAAIINIVNKLVLSHPDIRFTFIIDGKTIYTTDGKNQLVNVLLNIYGRELIKNLLPIEATFENLKMTGYITNANYSRGNKQYQNLFINGRYIVNKDIQDAINNAYKMLITIGKFPAFAIDLNIPIGKVDVNIHPSKTEVKFDDTTYIKECVIQGVTQALTHYSLVPQAKITTKEEEKEYNKEEEKDTKIDDYFNAFKSLKKDSSVYLPSESPSFDNQENLNLLRESEEIYEDAFIETSRQETQSILESDTNADIDINIDTDIGVETDIDTDDVLHTLFAEEELETEQLIIEHKLSEQATLYDNLTIVGILFDAYIVCQRSNSAYIIDQHAAHERVLYEKFLRSFKASNVSSQIILEPIIYESDLNTYHKIEQALPQIEQMGITIESFGDNSWIIRAVPTVNGIPFNRESIYEIFDTFNAFGEDVITETSAEKIIRASCRAAVKARDKLTHDEVYTLFELLKHYDNPYTCPHGRPIIIELTEYEIEKKFKRV